MYLQTACMKSMRASAHAHARTHTELRSCMGWRNLLEASGGRRAEAEGGVTCPFLIHDVASDLTTSLHVPCKPPV